MRPKDQNDQPPQFDTAAVNQIDAMIGEDFWVLARRETEAISGYAEVEQQSQSPKRPAKVNQVG